MVEKQEMQEEDGLSTTKEAAGKSQGNGHKSQRRMAADPVLWIGVLCSSTSMCCAQCLGFWLHANKIHTQRFLRFLFMHSVQCVSVFWLCQRDTKDMGSRSKSGTNHSPTPFLTSSFSSESISAIFRLCFLCLLLTMRFYLYSQISSLPLLLPFSCAAIITIMCATVMRGTISAMLTKANNPPRLESNA